MSNPATIRNNRPRLSSLYRMQFEASQGCWVLLYPEGMVKLNSSAAEILRRCDGESNVEQLIATLERDYAHPDLSDQVHHFLNDARGHGWIV